MVIWSVGAGRSTGRPARTRPCAGGEHDHPVAGNAQKKASAGVDLALGLLLPAVGALAAADRLHGQRPQPVPAGDGQPGKPEKEKKDSWAARVLAEPRLGLTILVGARAMLETCGSAGKGTDVKEGVPSR